MTSLRDSITGLKCVSIFGESESNEDDGQATLGRGGLVPSPGMPMECKRGLCLTMWVLVFNTNRACAGAGPSSAIPPLQMWYGAILEMEWMVWRFLEYIASGKDMAGAV